MSLSWTSPTRRVDDRELPFLANEIYFCIFDYVHPSDEGLSERQCRRILSRLAKVCRFFCAVALPRIFHTMEFEFPLPDAVVWPKSLNFCKELNVGREPAASLVSHIKKCSMTPPAKAAKVPGFPACMSIYMRAIPRLSLLESLALSSVKISNELRQGLKQMKRLQGLSIHNCTFDSSHPTDKQVPLHLTTFELLSTRSIPEDLHTFVNPASLSALTTDNWDFAKGLISLPFDFCIEILSVHFPMEESSILTDFLNRTPSITNLAIPQFSCESSAECELELSQMSLPRLDTVHCPPYLLPQLIPGRPVTKVNLDGVILLIGWSGDAFFNGSRISALTQSSAVITTLRIPWGFYTLYPFKNSFSQLRKLTFLGSPVDPQSIKFLETFSPGRLSAPLLQELVFERFMPSPWDRLRFDLKFQYQRITTVVAPPTSQLRRISFVEELYWRRENTNTAQWRPVIPMHLHERVKLSIMDEEQVTDFEGVLFSLFQTDEITDDIRRKLGLSLAS